MKYTIMQIELMDKYIKDRFDNVYYNEYEFAKKNDISQEEADYIISEACKIGHEKEILKAQYSNIKGWRFVSLNRMSCKSFIDCGGFLKESNDNKNDNDSKARKLTYDMIKVKTEILKNILWIIVFIFSVVLNLLYLSGLITFHFFQPNDISKEIKYHTTHKAQVKSTSTPNENNKNLDTLKVDKQSK